MQIFINKKPVKINSEKTLLEMLRDLKYDFQGIAVAINEQIIPFEKWEKTPLKNEDKILIIKAAQGG